jgi:membrane-associated phospholipid phosphatase
MIPGQAAAQDASPDQSATTTAKATEQTATEPPANVPANDPPAATDDAAAASAASKETRNFQRPVSWKRLFGNVLSDQKQIWTSPARMVQGKNWIPTTAVVGATAGLMFLDSSEAKYFRTTTTFHGFRNIVTGNATAIGMGAVPASMYAIGLLRKDSKMQSTALLTGEALADMVLVQTALKDITRRVRPIRYPDSGWFSTQGGPTSYLRGNGSFPSGHSMAAFAVATVVARQYGNHRWVPYVAYGMASLVGFSRLPLNVHFLSDVFMGGAMGYSISRFSVLRQ